MSDDYERGYEDGVKAVREAEERRDVLGKPLLGGVLASIKEFVAEHCNVVESKEYRWGFHKGVEDTVK
jgi:hypothetical protein